jgi:hypothetical protein
MKVKTIEKFLLSYSNIKNKNKNKDIYKQKGGMKEFTIKYKNDNYTFNRINDTDSMLTLYSYDGLNNDCILLNIEKEEKVIIISSFGASSKCFREEINIGSNLLNITLKMIEKYKNKLEINKIVLTDNSMLPCGKNKKSFNMAKMLTLLTGDTWYGKYGFRPFTNEFKLNKIENKQYEKNKEIMNTIKVKDINLQKYLLYVNKKYPDEFTIDIIEKIIENQQKKPNKLLMTFLNEFHGKNIFNQTCHFLYVYYEKLFKDIGLEIAGHIYGKYI